MVGSDTCMLAERGGYRFSIRNDGDAEDDHLSAGACFKCNGKSFSNYATNYISSKFDGGKPSKALV